MDCRSTTLLKTSLVFGWAVVISGSSMYSSHVADGSAVLGWSINGVLFQSSLFARLIVACSMLCMVGTLDGFCVGEKLGLSDGFLFVDLNFVGVCLMCPFEVIGGGKRYFWTAWYVK